MVVTALGVWKPRAETPTGPAVHASVSWWGSVSSGATSYAEGGPGAARSARDVKEGLFRSRSRAPSPTQGPARGWLHLGPCQGCPR